MSTIIDDINKYLKQFTNKAKKAEADYQSSGSPGYYRTYEKNSKLVEICQIALNAKTIVTDEKNKRIRNIEAYKEKLEERDYTFKELEKIISDIQFM